MSTTFPCVMVRRENGELADYNTESLTLDQLPPGEVLIEVAASSINYKDALACRAHPGVVKQLPHIPGIDCAGQVVESTASPWKPGDKVLVTGYGLGSEHWGGWSRYVRVPNEWIVRLPGGLTIDEAMTYGTAGFTAAQCVERILNHGIRPEHGEVVVTGATGGVGCLAIALLARLGYRVAAVTGKAEHESTLRQLGATTVLPRAEVDAPNDRPLLGSRWAAAVDTVGGNILNTLLRTTAYRGCVTACGLVAGDQLPATVYPFLLRGITLYGIDSAKCPREPRLEIWRKLSSEWKLTNLDPIRREISFRELPAAVEEMLAGKSFGRVMVRPTV